MDKNWSIQEIEKFLDITSRVKPKTAPGVSYLGTVMKGSSVDAAESAYVVENIIVKVLPGALRDKPDVDKDYRWLRVRASHAKIALERREELAEKLGDNAPDMNASNLHPWVWESCKLLWNDGHYHQAVMAAAIQVNAETQKKLGRLDISEKELFDQAFSSNDPKPGRAQLRLRENDGSSTYASLHRGARAFAEGLYAGIRNPGMHEPPQERRVDEEQLALEKLAAFSILARWVDEATVVRG